MRGVFPISSTTEPAVRRGPEVATDISDWSSPGLYQCRVHSPQSSVGLTRTVDRGPRTEDLLCTPAFGIPRLDRTQIQLLELPLDFGLVPNSHNDHAARHQVFPGGGERLFSRHFVHLLGVARVVVEDEDVNENIRAIDYG